MDDLIGYAIAILFYGGYGVGILFLVTSPIFLLSGIYAKFTQSDTVIANRRFKHAAIVFFISLLLFAVCFGGYVMAFSLDKSGWH